MRGDDSLEELARLQRQIVELARQVPTEDPNARYEGRDASRTVRVEMDGSGTVSEVGIDSAWRRHLSTEEFAEAMQQAIQDAAMTRFASWGEGIGTQRPGRARSTSDPLASATASAEALTRTIAAAAQQADRAGSERALQELLSMLERIEATIDETSARLDEQLGQTHTGRTRHVVVEVSAAKDVTDIQYDEDWLETAHEVNIARETRDALRQAYQKAAQHGIQTLMGQGPLGELQRLTDDPVALVRKLGLRPGE